MNDYFGSKTFDGSSFTEDMIRNPDTFWTPDMMLDFTRIRQKALSRPGEKFFYSDTGYILLGLVIEEVFKMPFYQALETYLFKPAGMKDTHLCFYSEGLIRRRWGRPPSTVSTCICSKTSAPISQEAGSRRRRRIS